jgi:hypothetical protein
MFPNNAAASKKLRGEARACVKSEDLVSQPVTAPAPMVSEAAQGSQVAAAEEVSGVAGETVDETRAAASQDVADEEKQPAASQNVRLEEVLTSTMAALDSSQHSDTTLQMGQVVESQLSETELDQTPILAGCTLPPLPLTLATLAAATSLSELEHDNVAEFIALMHSPAQNPPDASNKRRNLTRQSSDTRMTDVSDDEPDVSLVNTPILAAYTPQGIQSTPFQGLRGRGERIQDFPSLLYV